MKKFLNSIIWIIVGGAFLFLTLRDKELDVMFNSIFGAKAFWVAMNGVALVTVFILRGYRWKLLLENNGEKPPLIYVLYSLCVGFFVNSFTPRFGEVVRCTTLKKTCDTPVAKSLGTMVTERLWDVLILVLGLIVIFILEAKRLRVVWEGLIEWAREMIINNGLLFAGILLLLIIVLIVAYRVLKSRNIFEKGKVFMMEFWQTLKLSFKIKRYPRFLFLTLTIWVLLTSMNYFCLQALEITSDGSVLYLSFVIVFVVGIGWAIPVPSGIGTTHFIVDQLFEAFKLSENSGVAYGVLSNGLTFGFTILIGGMSLVVYGLFNKKKLRKAEELAH